MAVYLPGRSHKGVAAGLVGVQAEGRDKPHTVVPAPEDSLDIVLGHFGRDLKHTGRFHLKILHVLKGQVTLKTLENAVEHSQRKLLNSAASYPSACTRTKFCSLTVSILLLVTLTSQGSHCYLTRTNGQQ